MCATRNAFVANKTVFSENRNIRVIEKGKPNICLRSRRLFLSSVFSRYYFTYGSSLTALKGRSTYGVIIKDQARSLSEKP